MSRRARASASALPYVIMTWPSRLISRPFTKATKAFRSWSRGAVGMVHGDACRVCPANVHRSTVMQYARKQMPAEGPGQQRLSILLIFIIKNPPCMWH